ncbi:MAG: 4-hydroxy-tetrahydrodipicolinate synthase [Candidatus Dormibacteria bacterium]
MSARIDMGRVLTAMVTPFARDGSLDLAGAESLAAFLVANGNDGLVVAGTTGESPTLTPVEKIEVLRAVRGAAPGAVVVMGAGSNDTQASIDLARQAVAAGADVVMAVVPYYNKPPQQSLFAHFSAIAGAVDAPVLLYNVPSRTASNLAAQTTLRLAEIDNIVAIKEASADLNQAATVAAAMPSDFRIYSGDDSLTLPMLAVGAHGVVSVAGHLAGPGIQAMVAAFFAGRVDAAASLHHRLMPIFEQIFCVTSPIPMKAVLGELGLPGGPTRLPLSRDDLAAGQLDSLLKVVGGLGELGAGLPPTRA